MLGAGSCPVRLFPRCKLRDIIIVVSASEKVKTKKIIRLGRTAGERSERLKNMRTKRAIIIE